MSFDYGVGKPGKFVWNIRDLHKEYGPIIRVTPWEVHVNDVGFLDDIYAPSFRRREKYDLQTRTLKVPFSVGGSVQHELHRKRPEALNPFFSEKFVAGLGPMIDGEVKQLCQNSEDHLNVGSRYSVGHDNNLLGDTGPAASLRDHLSSLLLGVKFKQHFPWIVDWLDMLPLAIGKFIMPPGVLDMIDFTSKIRGEIEQILDSESNSGNSGKRSIFYELRDSPSLPPSEKTILRLEHEGTLLVMAGTESTAKSIAISHYHLLSNPNMMARLRAELRTVPDTATWPELEQLPYLSAVIAEGNRPSFGVTARVCRIASDEALQYDNYTIPPGTPVSMTTLCVHTNEKIFPEPWKFNPDRWLGQEGAEKRKYQMAFNKGGRNCVGINLAHAEMFLAIAAVARYDLELFETDIADVEFQHDYHVAYPKLDSKGVRAIVRGKAGMD